MIAGAGEVGEIYMKYTVIFAALLFSFATHVLAETGSVKGCVFDAQNKSPLVGVNISLSGTSIGTTTGNSGNFLLENITAGKATLTLSFIGFQPVLINVMVNANELATRDIYLEPTIVPLGEIVVTSTKYEKKL